MATFDDFAADAAMLFGMDEHEAANLLDNLEGDGFDLDDDDLMEAEWAEAATDYLDTIYDFDDPQYEWMDYDLDDTWESGDEWVEAGDEYEVTVDYEERR